MALALCLLTAAREIRAPTKPGDSERGVIVETVGKGSALAKAGIHPGDIVLAWERLPDPPSNPQGARGEIESAFDWMSLVLEQAPRGSVQLTVRRGGEELAFTVEPGSWKEAEVRPWMPQGLLEDYQQGRQHLEAGRIAEATGVWEKAIPGMEDRRLRCWMWLRLGKAWTNAHEESDKALAAYRSALAEADDAVHESRIWEAIGWAHMWNDEHEPAYQAYDKAREISQREGQSLSLALSLNYLGVVIADSEDQEQAADFSRSALEIRQRLAPGSLEEAESLNDLGWFALRRGEVERAAGLLERALKIRETLAPDSIYEAETLINIGTVHSLRGSLERAEAAFERVLEICEAWRPDSRAVARTLYYLGNTARLRGEPERAKPYYRRALEIQQKLAPDGLLAAATVYALGLMAEQEGELAEARDLHQRALEIRKRLAPASLDLANSLHSLGLLAERGGNPEGAMEFHRLALEIREKLAPGSQVLAETLQALGALARQRRELARAASFYLRALDTLESQLDVLGGSHDVRAGFRALHHEYYREALEVQLELGRPDSAFHILERSRAASFLEQLTERDTVFTADIPEELDRERRRLAARIDGIQRQVHLGRIADASGQLRQLRDEQRDVEEKIRRASPRLAALQYPQPLDFEAARTALDPGTAMLSYSVGKATTDLFIVTHDGPLEVHSLPFGEKQFKELVNDFHLRTNRSGWHMRRTARLQSAKYLYEILIAPAEDTLRQSDRLLIVPDGPLHLLHFAALARETGTDAERPWQYLVEWKPLHSVLSATVYAELRKSRRENQALVPMVAFGNPECPPELQQAKPGNGDGKLQIASVETISDVYVRDAVERGATCSQLPGSRREVERIDEIRSGVTVFLGAGATEERAKATGKDIRIVHFAVHGELDDSSPHYSYLMLAAEGRDNGLLQVWEIYERVRLDADLVVLSACASALGEEQAGEGLIGLTRAFQYAGARTVAATLWKVADHTTAVLMERFYTHLSAGKPKDEALRSAQIDLIHGRVEVKDGDRQIDASAPYYWAAFQLYGDWR